MVGKYITEWNVVKTGEVKSADIRKDYICSLSITLVALGYAGNAIIQQSSDTWESHLKKLADIDWRKTNPDCKRQSCSKQVNSEGYVKLYARSIDGNGRY